MLQTDISMIKVTPVPNRINRSSKKSVRFQDSNYSEDENMIQESYFEHLVKEMNLSYKALKEHINLKHPKKSKKLFKGKKLFYKDSHLHWNWSIWQNTGTLINFPCCSKFKILKFQRDIGLGPALYLISLKAYIKLFLLACVLSIPQYVVLQSGLQTESQDFGGGLSETFAKVSLGNIAQQYSVACAQADIAQTDGTSLSLSCPMGKMQKIISVGLINYQDQEICNSDKLKEDFTNVDFDPNCSSYLDEDIATSEGIQALTTGFDANCKDQSTCDLTFEYTQLPQTCLDEVARRQEETLAAETGGSIPEPIFSIIAYCDNQILKIKGFDAELNKDQLNEIIATFDIIVILVLVIGHNIIQYMQKDFAKYYDEHTVEVKDFTLVIDKLPQTFKQYKDPISLKYAIWFQIQSKIEMLKLDGRCDASVNPSIVEINIQTSDIEIIQMQKELKNQIDKINVHYIEILRQHNNDKHFSKTNAIGVAKYKIMKNVKHVQRQLDLLRLKYSEELGLDGIQVDADEIKETEKFKAQIKSQEFQEGIKEIHITFESMQAKNLIEQAFKAPQWSFKMIRLSQLLSDNNVFQEVKKLDEEQQQQKHHQTNPAQSLSQSVYIIENPTQNQVYYMEELEDKPDQEIKTKSTKNAPDIIIWQNYQLTFKQIILRRLASLLILIFLFVITLASLQAFHRNYVEGNDYRLFMKGESSICNVEITMDQAYNSIKDNVRSGDEGEVHEGLVSEEVLCFCRQQYMKDEDEFKTINFNFYHSTQVDEDDPDNENQKIFPDYCGDWLFKYEYAFQLSYVPSIITILLNNFLAVPLIIFSAYFEGHVSKDRLHYAIFIYLFIQWCFSISFVMPYYSVDQDSDQYTFFNQQWYLTISSALGITLCYMFLPKYVIQLTLYLFNLAKRYSDRQYQLHFSDTVPTFDPSQSQITKVEGENFNDGSNTTLNAVDQNQIKSDSKSQTDLNKLYTGAKFDIGISQAQIMMLIFVCLMYSGGMPLLYLVCPILLTIMYMYSKYMLIKYCQRSEDFNQSLIINSYKLLKYAFFAHLLMTILMYERCDAFYQLQFPKDHFDDSMQVHDVQQLDLNIDDKPLAAQIYAVFVGLFFVVYCFNLCMINPITCFFREGCCYQKDNLRKTVYEKSDNDGQLNNSPEDSISISRQSEILSQVEVNKGVQCKIDTGKWLDNLMKNDAPSAKEGTSNNFYKEITFKSLRLQYQTVIDDIAQANQRLNLYYRIAGTNVGKDISKLFINKYKGFLGYHQALVSNKEKIENIIDYYYNFVNAKAGENKMQNKRKKENKVIKVRATSNSAESDNIDDSGFLEEFEFMSNEQDKGDLYQNENGEGVGRGIKNKPKIQLNETDEQQKRDQEDDNERKIESAGASSAPKHDIKNVNATINSFQRQNTAQIKEQDQNEEKMLREQSIPYIEKLEYLESNFDEKQLRTLYLGSKFRCEGGVQSFNMMASEDFQDLRVVLDRALVILKNPFFIEDKLTNKPDQPMNS